MLRRNPFANLYNESLQELGERRNNVLRSVSILRVDSGEAVPLSFGITVYLLHQLRVLLHWLRDPSHWLRCYAPLSCALNKVSIGWRSGGCAYHSHQDECVVFVSARSHCTVHVSLAPLPSLLDAHKTKVCCMRCR